MVRDADNMPYGVSNSFKRGTMKTYSSRRLGSRPETQQTRNLLDAFFARDSRARIRYSMDENGHVKEETILPASNGSIVTSTTILGQDDASAPASASAVRLDLDANKDDAEPSSPVSRGVFSETSASEQTQLTSASPPSSPPPTNITRPSLKSSGKNDVAKKAASSAVQVHKFDQKEYQPRAHKSRSLSYNSLKRKRTSYMDENDDNDVSSSNANNTPNGKSDKPLSETTANSARKTSFPPAKRTRLTQMQLDLGRAARKTCRDCGMEYVATSREDAKLHADFHAMNLGGVDMGTGFSRESRTVEKWGFGEVVNVVERKDAGRLRRRVRKVLEVADKDLGAVEIPEDRLWGVKGGTGRQGSEEHRGNTNGGNDKRRRESADGAAAGNNGNAGSGTSWAEEEGEDRYKAFLYLAGDKCVGLCLAERIRSATKVVANDALPKGGDGDNGNDQSTKDDDNNEREENEDRAAARSSCIRTEESYDPMLLGISRIWVSKSHRRKGIAQTLLDCARTKFFYGIEVPKKMVAFSQPTESGGRLAEAWYGGGGGWHVYADAD